MMRLEMISKTRTIRRLVKDNMMLVGRGKLDNMIRMTMFLKNRQRHLWWEVINCVLRKL